MSELEQIAASVVEQALKAGATDAECTLASGTEFSVNVRMGEVEQLKEATSRGAGLRLFQGRKSGSATTSDLTPDGIRKMVQAAMDNAAITSEDPFAGLPSPKDFGKTDLDLQMYSSDLEQVDTPTRIALAKAVEEAALKTDPRINNSEGGAFGSYLSERAFANSRGFSGSYRSSSCSISAVPVAAAEGKMERDYWMSSSRSFAKLESPEQVGTEAARRTLRRLGARKISTRKAPIIFEPRIARSLLSNIFEAVSGDSIYRHASFLENKLEEKIASDLITVIDDPTIPGLFGSAPFDDEGIPGRRKVVIEKGVLKTYLHNTYTARKMGTRTTGNAGRGLAGSPWVDRGNFFIENGTTSPADMIGNMKEGLLVTELMGQGVNIVNGDYSRGAAGLWIENGEIAYPVSEITIAGNLKDILMRVNAVGNDLEFRGSSASPTLMIEEMTISGS